VAGKEIAQVAPGFLRSCTHSIKPSIAYSLYFPADIPYQWTLHTKTKERSWLEKS